MDPNPVKNDVTSLARRAAAICADNKANDVVLLDLHEVTDMTDYFIVASGTSIPTCAASRSMWSRPSQDGVRVQSVEGLTQGRWVLLDYVDFVVQNVFPSIAALVLPTGAALGRRPGPRCVALRGLC